MVWTTVPILKTFFFSPPLISDLIVFCLIYNVLTGVRSGREYTKPVLRNLTNDELHYPLFTVAQYRHSLCSSRN